MTVLVHGPSGRSSILASTSGTQLWKIIFLRFVQALMWINFFAPRASSRDTSSHSLLLANRCGRVPSLLHLLLIASLLVSQATAFSCPLSEKFAATVNCNDDSYENQCNVGGGSDYTTCECALNPGYYYVCTSNCNDYNYRKDGICVQCFAGSYFNLIMGIQCQPNCCVSCPSGTFSTQGQSVCSNCPVGTYSQGGQPNACISCPVGQYQSQTKASSCVNCSPGSFQGKTGQSSCTSCSPGYYSDSFGAGSCSPCPAGTFTDDSNTDYGCKPTPPGSYVSTTGLSQVYPCPYGSYSPTQNSTACISCEVGLSTFSIGSSSESDCVACEFGVDPVTLGCVVATSNGLNDVCWNPSQLLGLNNSIAVNDLYNLMFKGTYGINALMNNTIGAIQSAASNPTPSSLAAIKAAYATFQNATQAWFSNAWNTSVCQANTENNLSADSELGVLLTYQFGQGSTNRINWIANWRCTGATFGCAGNTVAKCPMAATCFSYLTKAFSGILNAPGGMTSLGNNPASPQGRRTPMYSTSYLANQLVLAVGNLTSYQQQVQMAKRYFTVLQSIQESTSEIESFTSTAFNAELQVQATQQATALSSSQTIGNLYYQQFQYNYNVTNELALQVQNGPPPQGGSTYQQLIKKCQTEMKVKAALKVCVAAVALCAGFGEAFAAEGAVEAGKEAKPAGEAASEAEKAAENPEKSPATAEASADGGVKLAGTAMSLTQSSFTLLQSFAGALSAFTWDPNSQLPTFPDATDITNPEYNDAAGTWYLNAQKNLSNALISLSPAFWQNFYLEAENNVEPTINNPPGCGVASSITDSLNEYLNTVQNFSNYGNAMTSAAMSLAPVLGNIATAISTLGAINQASQTINSTLAPSSLSLTTAPTDLFPPKPAPVYVNTTEQILALSPSITWLNNAYLAAFSVYQFCQSYGYSNANTVYSNCVKFGSNYVPSASTFQAFAASLTSSSTLSTYVAPQLVQQLQSNLRGFASSVQADGSTFGERGSIGSQYETFNVEITANSTQVFGDLKTGLVNFMLSPSSDLLATSTSGAFQISDANPRVFNVQVFWRNVQDPLAPKYPELLTSNIFVGNQQLVYTAVTGVPAVYSLPPFGGGNEAVGLFGTSTNIQPTASQRCSNSQDINWLDGSSTSFCTDVEPNVSPSLSTSFLYPSLWSSWRIEAQIFDTFTQTGPVELLVQFMYVASNQASNVPIVNSFKNCQKLTSQSQWQYNPLSTAFCAENACSTCGVMAQAVMDNVTAPPKGGFCLCNVWKGQCTSSDICPTVVTPPVYLSISPSSSIAISGRNLKGSTMNIAQLQDATDDYLLGEANYCLKANPSFWNVTGSIRDIKTQIKVVNWCRDGTIIAELSMLKLTHSFQGPIEGCIKLALNAAAYERLLRRKVSPDISAVQVTGSGMCIANSEVVSGGSGTFLPGGSGGSMAKGPMSGMVQMGGTAGKMMGGAGGTLKGDIFRRSNSGVVTSGGTKGSGKMTQQGMRGRGRNLKGVTL